MSDSTSDTIKVDTARLPLLPNELRLPTIAAMWPTFTDRADREAWPAARLLATLTELELAERFQRRIQRHLIEARLPPGKTLDNFDFYRRADERGCEIELSEALTEQMQQHPSRADGARAGVIDIQSLRERFAPVRETLPEVAVKLPAIASYD